LLASALYIRAVSSRALPNAAPEAVLSKMHHAGVADFERHDNVFAMRERKS
jgi:hypothetical protein